MRVGVRVDVRASGWRARCAAHIILGLLKDSAPKQKCDDSSCGVAIVMAKAGKIGMGSPPSAVASGADGILAHGMLTVPSWERHPYDRLALIGT